MLGKGRSSVVALLVWLSLSTALRGQILAGTLRAYPLAAAPVACTASIQATLNEPGAKSDLPAKLRAAIARVERQRPASKRSTLLRSAIAALESRAGSSLEVRIRQSSQTPMWIAGRVLEPRASGHTAALRAQETARSFLRHNRELLGIEDPDAELVLEGDEQDLLGQRHLRFAQRYRGLTVWPSELVVRLDPEGNVVLVNGAYVRTPAKLEVQPAIPAEEAIAAARRTVPGGVPAPPAHLNSSCTRRSKVRRGWPGATNSGFRSSVSGG